MNCDVYPSFCFIILCIFHNYYCKIFILSVSRRFLYCFHHMLHYRFSESFQNRFRDQKANNSTELTPKISFLTTFVSIKILYDQIWNIFVDQIYLIFEFFACFVARFFKTVSLTTEISRIQISCMEQDSLSDE